MGQFLEKVCAAFTIQAKWKEALMNMQSRKLVWAVVKLQGTFRGRMERKNAKIRHKWRILNSVLIQVSAGILPSISCNLCVCRLSSTLTASFAPPV